MGSTICITQKIHRYTIVTLYITNTYYTITDQITYRSTLLAVSNITACVKVVNISQHS
jgi:hypothetical protein